ncbi:cellulase [Colletotrichum filicis]|nr:cellulase [Colletotrichum filicis]
MKFSNIALGAASVASVLACVSSTIGAERLAVATKWLKDNNKQGVLGEIGAGVNTQCETAVKGALQHLADNSEQWRGAYGTYLPILKSFI